MNCGLPNRTRLSLRVEARVVLCCVSIGMNGSSTRLEGLLAPTVEAMGFSLWGIEYSQRNRRGNLWVFIDSKKGVTVDDCARVSDQIEAVLDIEKILPEDLRIQVSSPGMDRVLFKPEQFEAYVGEVIDVRLLWPKMGRSHIRGRLCASGTERFSVDMDEGQLELEFDQVRRARIVPTFN
ncbi:MAG: ribosome maturation factor RimP [Gammaproteobacteria bacterium]|nr:ribosome maturation factor RimP [Gammaproteobacteria bacterium]MYD79315.1 ribosome maturation factor RimP [Gammaproteobacteria bacterium]